MKLTFPHMGNTYVAVEALFEAMGHDVIVPPVCTKRTLDLGTKYSPETACLPLKITIGNFIEAIENGAESLVMLGGCGPCRLGYYAEMQRQILNDIGYQAEMIILDPPRENLPALIKEVRTLLRPRGVGGIIYGCLLAWEKLLAVEKLELAAHKMRPFEDITGGTSRKLSTGINALRKARTVRQIRRTTREWTLKLTPPKPSIQLHAPLKVGIVGEIYTVLEPFVSLQLEERLGHMGVEVYRTISLTKWIKEHILKASIGIHNQTNLKQDAAGYLSGFVGGHGLETVARTAKLARTGFDGVIQILPFTCMPEIMAQAVLPQISNDLGIPVLSLVVDEHTGEAGFQTRLEAFVDLLQRRKGQAGYEQTTSVSGS